MAEIIFAPEAIKNLYELYEYIYNHEGKEQAEIILTRIEKRIYTLETLALRGKLPEELSTAYNSSIREIQEKPWRIFYRPEKDKVFVLTILNGKRNIEELLLKKLMQ